MYVCVCVCVCVYMHVYEYIYYTPRVPTDSPPSAPSVRSSPTSPSTKYEVALRLYKILFDFKVLLWESIILLLHPPPTTPTLLQYYCTLIAQYTPRHRRSLFMPCTIHYW